MIRLIDVTKTFRVGDGRKIVLQDVTLDFPKGRNVAVLGRNGAGKSTLLEMIGGSTLPDRGEIRRDGLVSWPLGFKGGFHTALTGRQNTRFIARIYGVDTEDLIERVEAFAELGEFMDMPISAYSSGMSARLAFGLSMSIDFDVYLVDEITAVGDSAFKRKCKAAFHEKAERATLVMVSHSVSTIRTYCDAGVVMEGGDVVYYDEVEAALAAHEANMGREPKSKGKTR